VDYKKTAKSVLDGLGGADNVDYFTHCATRLRVTIGDRTKVDKSQIEKTDGVLSVIEQAGQTQVVIGNEVSEVYTEMTRLPGMDRESGSSSSGSKNTEGSGEKKAGIITRMFDVLSDSFRPVLWALLGSSMILTLIVLLQQLGVFGHYTNFAGQNVTVDLVNGPKVGDDAANEALMNTWRSQFPFWFIILGAAMSVLNFMPVFIGATAAKRLGANMWVGAAIPAALMTDAFRGLSTMAGDAGHITLFHIGDWGVPLYLFNYTGQVFPPLFAVAVLAPLERLLKKIIPSMLHMVFVPMISILIMVPLTALIIGPIGVNLGLGISKRVSSGSMTSIRRSWGVVVAGSYLFMVPLGLPLAPQRRDDFETSRRSGTTSSSPPMARLQLRGVSGVVTGVAISCGTRQGNFDRSPTGRRGFSGLLGGISEPSLYGRRAPVQSASFSADPGARDDRGRPDLVARRALLRPSLSRPLLSIPAHANRFRSSPSALAHRVSSAVWAASLVFGFPFSRAAGSRLGQAERRATDESPPTGGGGSVRPRTKPEAPRPTPGRRFLPGPGRGNESDRRGRRH
jgi:PTS system beta-glucosides-specific IIC component